jgi:hypothetical protein
MQHLDQNCGNDLPRHTEFVFEPAALYFLSAIGSEFLPKKIHFFLCLAVRNKRDRFVKFKDRTAVERCEFLAFELELDGRSAAFSADSP